MSEMPSEVVALCENPHLYRALVAARWEDAVARGTPYLTTQARPSSYPILKRMGFEDVCELRVLNDSF